MSHTKPMSRPSWFHIRNACLFFGIFLLLTSLTAEEAIPYLNQTFIDTVVQNAYYNFISASSLPDDDAQQEKAIDHAKKVSKELKKLAKRDPNRSYILWRVNELEHQIFLEEQEVEMKRSYKRQKEVNKLVNEFNSVIGEKRPNFAGLYIILQHMQSVDNQKADELEGIIVRRNKNISRESTYFCDQALNSGNYTKAASEFDYIRQNRKYLYVQPGKYDYFERRLFAKKEADDIIENSKEYLSEINSNARNGEIRNARYALTSLRLRIQSLEQYIEFPKYSSIMNQLSEYATLIETKEDSLVTENMALVNEGNVERSVDYLERVVRKRGVSNSKIRIIDKAILAMPGAKNHIDRSVESEISSISNEEQPSGSLTYDALQNRIRQKVDSIHAGDEESSRLSQTAYEEENRKILAANQEENIILQRNQEKAKRFITKLYQLLDENEVKKAYVNFMKLRIPLKKYTDPEIFGILEKTIMKAYESFLKEEDQSAATD
ncbi:MAG: hypothetical protein JW795_19700 [Chitinivibrionales bacterium]|nr:hypothetical protein [Chitinivibrionales bacterium]